MSIQINQARFVKVSVTPKTAWYFAKVVNSNGLETVVEFTVVVVPLTVKLPVTVKLSPTVTSEVV